MSSLPSSPQSTLDPIQAANPHHSAIVKASAGAGKTYLLVTRLIRLLLLDVRPDAILAITFTRKAAAEMQSRLFDRLYSLATIDEDKLKTELLNIGVEDTPAMFKKARGLYEHIMRNESQVKTNTFHAFCQEILRKFPLESNVPPGFELLNDEPSYLAAAWDALYEEATLDPNSKVASALEALYTLSNGLSNTQSSLDSFVNQRSDWWAYTAAYENPTQAASEKLLDELSIDLDATPYADFFCEERKNEINRIAELHAQHDTKTNLKHVDILLAITAENIFDSPQSQNNSEEILLSFSQKLSSVLFKADGNLRFEKRVKARAKKMTEDGEDEFLALWLSVCKRLNTAHEIAKKQHNYYFNQAWYVAGEALLNHFQKLKEQQRLLDFTDLEWRTFTLLNHSENSTWVQYKLDQRIEHLLVDEFQDTNPTQWRLLLPLMQEFVTDTDRLRSVFLVGDEKQSIYSFRRADPKLFTTASDWLSENLDAQFFPMDKSRRSSTPIMHLLNNVFMSDDFKHTLPNFQTHSTFLNDEAGEIHLLPLIEPQENTDDALYFRNAITTPFPPEDNKSYREGQQIAEHINTLINGCDNNFTYKDVMLLIRSRKHLNAYETALREAGIPYASNNKGTLFECQEIQDLISLMDVLYTPYNNLSLATILRSPIFLCSNDDLLFLTEVMNTSKTHSWFDALTFDTLTQENETWPASLVRASTLLTQWQKDTGRLPIHDMLDKIFFEADIFHRYRAAVPKHFRNRVKSNLTQLLSLALDIDSGRYPSLGRFIAKLHSLIQNDASPDEAIDMNSSGTVRILTIHGSKGLEAPIVFLADAADQKRASKKGYTTLVDWPEESDKPTTFLICPKKENQIEIVNILLEQQKEKAIVEDANLLYVALTRARQRLYISGCGESEKGLEKLGWYGLLKKHWPDEEQAIKTTSVSQFAKEDKTASHAPSPFPSLFTCETKNNDEVLIDDSAIISTSSSTAPSETETIEPEDDKAQLRGTIIHRAIELISTYTTSESSEVKEQLSAEFNMATTNQDFIRFFDEAHKTVCHNEFSLFFDPANFNSAYNEMPIQIRSGNGINARLKHGIIDRLVVNDDTVTIIDYKTHPKTNDDELKLIAESYQPQMQHYANAIKLIWPNHRIKNIILFTHSLKNIELF